MQRRLFVGLAVVLFVFTAGTSLPVSGASGVDSGVAPEQGAPQLQTPDGFDSTEFRLRVYENGSTRWTIIHTRILENESQRSQYESFASEFNSTETETFQDFKVRAAALAAYGSRETSRQMNATAFSRVAQVEQPFGESEFRGTLQMSFTWTNFAATTERGVTVADVFEGGMYIGPDQRMVFQNGSGLLFAAADPTPDSPEAGTNLSRSDSLTYRGEQNFSDEHPKVVFLRPDARGTTSDSTTNGETTAATTPAGAIPSEIGPMPIVIAVLLLLIVGGGIAWYTGDLGDRGGEVDTTTDGAADADAPAEAVTPAEPAVPDEELLSDEDRVLKLLDENGGRMKQVNIVENTEWSKSKVSMLLSDMEEEGLISKLRVGRENIISKAGEEPDAVGSPFDDE